MSFLRETGTQHPTAQLTRSDNLLLHIQFKLGQKPGFPNSGPGGIAHHLLLNSPKNTLPFRTPGGLSGGGRQTLCRWLLAGRILRIAACRAHPRPVRLLTIWSGPGKPAIPSCALPSGLERFMAPRPPLSGLREARFCCGRRTPTLPPSAARLPEGHLANVHINGLSASMANFLISHKTAWNSAPKWCWGRGCRSWERTWEPEHTSAACLPSRGLPAALQLVLSPACCGSL